MRGLLMGQKDITAFYTYLQSQQTAQKFLYDCYQKIEGVDAASKSFENCNTFMYYLDHGKQFYENGKNIDILLQPMLFFYGMVHLIKANLLTIRPNYPESTTILAHGVSTRKRKKKDYTFMQDEVRTQHNGLFPYFSEHLFYKKRLPFEKIKMEYLFALIPEMSELFTMHNQEKMIVVGNATTTNLHFPNYILDNYHLTAKAFIQRIRTYMPAIKNTEFKKSSIQINLASPLNNSNGPFFIHSMDNSIYFPLNREISLPISEVMVHYLLLYNLSMLCRYESEWWGDLLSAKSDADYPFIVHFLKNTADKIPLLLGKELTKRN